VDADPIGGDLPCGALRVDGQAYVCLPESADPIVSPDEDLIDVVECSHLLVETDLLDGILID